MPSGRLYPQEHLLNTKVHYLLVISILDRTKKKKGFHNALNADSINIRSFAYCLFINALVSHTKGF